MGRILAFVQRSRESGARSCTSPASPFGRTLTDAEVRHRERMLRYLTMRVSYAVPSAARGSMVSEARSRR